MYQPFSVGAPWSSRTNRRIRYNGSILVITIDNPSTYKVIFTLIGNLLHVACLLFSCGIEQKIIEFQGQCHHNTGHTDALWYYKWSIVRISMTSVHEPWRRIGQTDRDHPYHFTRCRTIFYMIPSVNN